MTSARTLAASLALISGIASATSLAVEPPTGISIVGPAHVAANLRLEQLAQLPPIQIQTNFLTESGQHAASFEGPLLWSVLEKMGVIDPAKHREQVSEIITVIGRDGYRAVLAVGEIAPEFEAKQVILAESMNGKPLEPDHLRVVVPLDKRGGRSVRDVARIEVAAPAGAQ
jgi:hypothetical protein